MLCLLSVQLFQTTIAQTGITESGIAQEPSAHNQLEQGRTCAQMTDSRLARLSCFDAVFNTPLSTQKATPIIPSSAVDPRPALWHQVIKQEGARTSPTQEARELGFISNKASKRLSEKDLSKGKVRIILTQSATGTFPPRPVLVFSCIDNITRLQLLLHSPIDEGVMPLSLLIDDKALPSRWFSEENGYLIRAGRGLPGIQDIKAMLHKKRLVIRSKTTEIDGLSFDLTNLNAAIDSLRQACHW